MAYTNEEKESLVLYLEMLRQAALALNAIVTDMALWQNIDGGRTFAGIASRLATYVFHVNTVVGELNTMMKEINDVEKNSGEDPQSNRPSESTKEGA